MNTNLTKFGCSVLGSFLLILLGTPTVHAASPPPAGTLDIAVDTGAVAGTTELSVDTGTVKTVKTPTPKRPVRTLTPTTDSSGIRPNLDVNVRAPGAVTHATQITNQAWPTTACPVTPSDCPGINDPRSANPALYPSTCPAICKVEQSPLASTMTNASCPAGYSQIGAFRSQPEYEYVETAQYRYPRSMDEFNNYRDLQYSCYPYDIEYVWKSGCSSGTGNNHPKQWDYGQYVSGTPFSMNRVVYMSSYPFQRCSTAGSNCSDSYKISCSISGDWEWRYYYKYVECRRDAGNYPTGRYITGSVACARIQPAWQ